MAGLYKDLDVAGGQCPVSDWEQTTAEWRVDLGGVINIHHVFIHFATGNTMKNIIFLLNVLFK